MGTLDERKERIGKNEALFRAVNERVAELEASESELEAGSRAPESIEILCECGERDCVEQISLTLAEYERLREHSAHFAVIQGHEKPIAEDVVASTDRYHVVQKHAGGPMKLAAETDPRR